MLFVYSSMKSLTLYMVLVHYELHRDPSHMFHASKQFIDNRFMDLGNPFEIIVHYLLIGERTCLGHRNGSPMMNALVYMVIH